MARGGSGVGEFLPKSADGLSWWRPEMNRSNHYGQDRAAQHEKTFTGIPTIPLQDQAATESMGPIYDRTQEHLGTSDAMIIRVRRRLIRAARELSEQGVTPPGVDNPEWYRVRDDVGNAAEGRGLARPVGGLAARQVQRDPGGEAQGSRLASSTLLETEGGAGL